ncbi:lycopene cyclase family protein [Actinomadura yumaensis]|uniref:lycopene cyclase family protein n=1 Tax=Actinomadura yumaensis TaxID=111807 RepID=UPI00361B9190
MSGTTARVDLLVIGSGPAGAAFARRTLDTAPDATVLIVEAGPWLTAVPGHNIRNLPPGSAPSYRNASADPSPAASARSAPARCTPGPARSW